MDPRKMKRKIDLLIMTKSNSFNQFSKPRIKNQKTKFKTTSWSLLITQIPITANRNCKPIKKSKNKNKA